MLYSDYTTGVATNAGDTIELRVRDGAGITKKDVLIAIEAFERFFENAQLVGPAGFDVGP